MTALGPHPPPVGVGRKPRGPSGIVRSTLRFAREPLAFVGEVIERYGDVAAFRLPQMSVIAVNHPHQVKRVLQDNIANYLKDTPPARMTGPFLGQGLSTVSDMATWRRNRRLVQPAFHRTRIQALGTLMGEAVEETAAEWARAASAEEPVEIGEQMSRLTLRIVLQALFGLTPDDTAVQRFATAVGTANAELGHYMRNAFIPLGFPTPGHRRFWTSLDTMDEVVYSIIRRFGDDDSLADREGMLALLMQTLDEDSGERMSDRELRDEVFTMLFAGHETSAATLTWVLYELSRRPDVETRVRAEIDTVLGGRTATMEDLPRLGYTRQVIQEALRLYPPTWQNYRRAAVDDEIGGYAVPAGTIVFFSFFHMHRHRDFWAEPEEFDPDRFAPEAVAGRDRSAYIPFGAGSRICIGNEFALTEMPIILTTLLQRFTLRIPPLPLAPAPLVTLRPDRPILARLEPRS